MESVETSRPVAPLRVSDLRKQYRTQGRNSVPVGGVTTASFEVQAGEVFTLLGPSGCGKTTTLRCVAGLERPDSGGIQIDGRHVFGGDLRAPVPAYKRNLGMVFQSYAVWPHMTVEANVGYPLTTRRGSRKLAKADVQRMVGQALEATEMTEYAHRRATELSGGQQQRLALARAIVGNPSLLLLDEPLSNLDAKLRERMRFELQRLREELGLTMVYVTHDQEEALSLSSRIAVMNRGRIEQIGTPGEIYDDPKTEFVARFIGNANVLDGQVESDTAAGDVALVDLGAPLGFVRVVTRNAVRQGEKVVVSIRPQRLDVEPLHTSRPDIAGDNRWKGIVQRNAFVGDAVDQIVTVGDLELRVRTVPSNASPEGAEVVLTVPPTRCSLVALSPAAADDNTLEPVKG